MKGFILQQPGMSESEIFSFLSGNEDSFNLKNIYFSKEEAEKAKEKYLKPLTWVLIVYEINFNSKESD